MRLKMCGGGEAERYDMRIVYFVESNQVLESQGPPLLVGYPGRDDSA